MSSSNASLRPALHGADAEAELSAAWAELRCCDDVNLDGSLAQAISELQQHRERAEAAETEFQNKSMSAAYALRSALERLRSWAEHFNPTPPNVSAFCELIEDVDAVLWGDCPADGAPHEPR